MPFYRNIQTGVVYKFAPEHWDSLSNQNHYEEVDSLDPDPPKPKRASTKKKTTSRSKKRI